MFKVWRLVVGTLRCFVFLTLLILITSGCTKKKKPEADQVPTEDTVLSDKKNPAPKKAGKTADWDYQKIREVRKAEGESAPTKEQQKKWDEEAANCRIVTESQMIRSGLSGCYPVDPRSGLGDGNFCCPNEDPNSNE